jgi:quinol monooxygenase YgiN
MIVTVIATMTAKPGQTEALKAELLHLVRETRREPGCLNYDLHQGLSDPATFVFHENWASQADLDRHAASPHLQAFGAKADRLVARREVLTYQRVEP